MSDTVISIESLGKSYRLNHQGQERYVALRDVIVRNVKGIFSKKPKTESSNTEEFWAVKDISFDIKRGDVVGIIGRNGAGKSTLLKLLSRITEPTTGRIRIRGTVASLLEVGTGFHPELTGRENIYLNGAILGMQREDIRRKFDEIVAFAEVERFLDTPIKRYSSGMSVRLAFAVAAHLEPEILIIDEVLAVGDAAFQKRCMGKMGEVSKNDGRTVLFVSHQMAAVENLCKTGIFLEAGTVTSKGPASDVIKQYITGLSELAEISLVDRTDRKGSGEIQFTSVTLQNEKRETVNSFTSGEKSIFVMKYSNHSGQDLRQLDVEVRIETYRGQRLILLKSELCGNGFQFISKDNDTIEIHIDSLPLAPGRYCTTLFTTMKGDIVDWVKEAWFFDVEPGDFYGTGKLPPEDEGLVLTPHHFSIPE
ncbi:MAG: ABC transporter ATP-binding protein [Chthoniobacteraceae bacterium]